MGCSDLYCFLCGNSYNNYGNHMKEEFIEEINKGNEYYISLTKKISQKKFIDKINNLVKNTEWINNCTFLDAFDNIIHNCYNEDCYNTFTNDGNYFNYYYHQTYTENYNKKYGVFLHTDCWRFIKNEYGIELTYSKLPIEGESIEQIFYNINYGKIEKYWDQHFNFFSLLKDNNEELCYSPLINNKAGKLIKKNFNKLKIRIDKNRISPTPSASFFKNGSYKIGNNNNIWIKNKSKWIPVNSTIYIKIKIKENDIKKIFKNIVYYAGVNVKPLFIYSYKKIDSKNIEFGIVTTEDYKKKLKLKAI